MEVTCKEQKRAERLLQRLHIDWHQIESFSFMRRYHRTSPQSAPPGKKIYGPGILTFHLQGGEDKTVYLLPFHRPSSVIRFLIFKKIPFDNYTPQERTATDIPAMTYRRPSLYMFWFFVLFVMFFLLGVYSISGGAGQWGVIPAAISFVLSIFFASMLMTRFCYLTLDNETLIIHSAGRTIRYPYRELRKINFDFARELNFTHIMEVLDSDYRYRLFYIGRVSRKKLNEISEHLQQAGIDATCSLNDNKRFFRDHYAHH